MKISYAMDTTRLPQHTDVDPNSRPLQAGEQLVLRNRSRGQRPLYEADQLCGSEIRHPHLQMWAETVSVGTSAALIRIGA
jgi:hypothetical protein